MINTRAGFWLQVVTVAVTLIAVIVRSVVGDPADHTFAAVLNIGVRPAAVLLPVAGILLVTSEWSQRTGMITFTLVPRRTRVLATKLIASLILALTMLVMSVTVTAAAVLIASPDVDGTWTHLAPLIAQSALYLTTGMVIAIAFGAILMATTPAIVALTTIPIAWAALASLSYFDKVAPWLDTSRALDPLPNESSTPANGHTPPPPSHSGWCSHSPSAFGGSRGAKCPHERPQQNRGQRDDPHRRRPPLVSRSSPTRTRDRRIHRHRHRRQRRVRYHRNPPPAADIVLLDVGRPDMTGFEANSGSYAEDDASPAGLSVRPRTGVRHSALATRSARS